jgi:hypothetical protein
MNRLIRCSLSVLALALAFRPEALLACAMCFNGNVDTPLTQGMNWGIFSLLAVVGCVLGGVASFAIFLARKAAAAPAPPVPLAANNA